MIAFKELEKAVRKAARKTSCANKIYFKAKEMVFQKIQRTHVLDEVSTQDIEKNLEAIVNQLGYTPCFQQYCVCSADGDFAGGRVSWSHFEDVSYDILIESVEADEKAIALFYA